MTSPDLLKVLLVEDSRTVAAYVSSVLASEPSIRLLPVAATAEEGVRAVRVERPSVVLMDMLLPDHDGIWAINEIMATVPCPIVVLSGHLSSQKRDITFESLRAGAVEVLAKPTGLTPQVSEAFRTNLVRTIRLMASAVVVRRRLPVAPLSEPPARLTESVRVLGADELAPIRHVVIGASTGGPELLSKLLSALSPPLPFSLAITQHTLEGFDRSLAEWLSSTGHHVVVARAGDLSVAGTILLAPADRHLELDPAGARLSPMSRRGSIASVDATFTSCAAYGARRCMAVLLTGMGRDGAQGMKRLHEQGALTVAQSAETCVVPNMPDSARALAAVRHSMTPEEIIFALHQLSRLRSERRGAGHPDRPSSRPQPRSQAERKA